MKKIILILSLFVLFIAGYFIYKWFVPREQTDPFTLVPGNAVLIIETSQIYNVWDELKSTKVWENIKSFPSVASLTEQVSTLDSMLDQENKVKFLEGKKMIASLHIGSDKNVDYLFYIPVNSAKEEKFFKRSLDNIKERGFYGIEERKLKGHTIWNVTSKKSKVSFSYINYKNLLIGSFSSVLLEDLIRSLDESKKNYFFWKKEEKVAQKLVEGKTNIYVQYKQLPSRLSLFSESKSFLSSIAYFAEESVLELNINNKEILLNGFTYAPKNTTFISNFKNQKPQPFNLKNYVSNNTMALYYYGFEDGVKLRKSLDEYWSKNDPVYMEEVRKINHDYKIDLGSLYADFGKEIGMSILESDSSLSDRLVYIQSKETEKLFLQLAKIATLASVKTGEKMSSEIWEGVKIKQMNIEDFPAKLLGKNFQGFPQCFFAEMEGYIVMSNNKKNIKNLLKDIDAENVWGKNLDINSSLEETITEFNIGFFANVQKSRSTVINNFSPDLREQMLKNPSLMEGLDFLALQFSNLNGTILTNLVLTHDLTDVLIEDQRVEKKELIFDSKLLPHIYLVENKSSGKDFLVQDSLMGLHLIGSDFKTKWSFSLTNFIKGEVFTIDIGKDRSWEYVFAAGNKIYALNSKGEMVNKFPITLDESVVIENISVIDYNNNKDYRMVVSDKNGAVYFFSVDGENLDGWKPRILGGKIIDRVKHLRIGVKDLIIAVQEDGLVNIMNRRGEMYEGFPLDLKTGPLKSFVIRKGQDFDKTLIRVQSYKGEQVSFTLKGKIKSKDKADSTLLCADAKGASYLVAKFMDGEVELSDMNSKRLFKIPANTNRIAIKYYNFSTKGEFVTIEDKQTNKFYIYSIDGKKMGSTPLSSEAESELFYNEKRKNFGVYYMLNNKIKVLEFYGN